MIQANELRIGNLTNEGRVFNFYEYGVHVGYGKTFKFWELTPIPLTEELLLKCGFLNSHNIWFEISTFIGESMFNHLNIETEINRATISRVNEEFVLRDNLKYLHQLQNLYFALTGTELEINL